MNVDILVEGCLGTMCLAFDSCINDLGDQVSANQSISVLPKFSSFILLKFLYSVKYYLPF